MSVEIAEGDVELFIEYDVIPPEPDQVYDRFGDPGTPGVGAQVDYFTATDEEGHDLTDRLSGEAVELIEAEILRREGF